MKKFMLKCGSSLASLALVMGVVSITPACHWAFHQPKVPQGMEKFSKK